MREYTVTLRDRADTGLLSIFSYHQLAIWAVWQPGRLIDR